MRVAKERRILKLFIGWAFLMREDSMENPMNT